MAYDPDNLFAKILRGESPCKKVYEDDHVLAFETNEPRAPIHVLAIPKGAYVSLDDFSEKASDEEIAGLFRAAGKIARDQGAVKDGYRIIANSGIGARQHVPHFHVHIVAGRPLGRILANGE